MGKRKESETVATVPGVPQGRFWNQWRAFPPDPRQPWLGLGKRMSRLPARRGPRRPARRGAGRTLQGAAPSGRVSSGDVPAAAGISSSSAGRNGRSGDQVILRWVPARQREQRRGGGSGL